MNVNPEHFGKKIKRFRLLNDIRQEDMAEKLKVSRATLINYEKGHTAINLEVLNRINDIYPNFSNEDESVKLKPRIIVDNSLDFQVLFSVLHKKKNYILFITTFFAFFGTLSSFLFTKYYDAEITLYPAKKDLSQGFSQFQAFASNLGVNTASNDQSFHIPDVVRSRLIAAKVIKQNWKMKNGQLMSLIDLWELNKENWFSINKKPLDSLKISERAIKKVNNHINVAEDKLTGLIKISCTFQDPYIAANIANYIGEQVELYIQKENSAQSKKEKLFISDRLSLVKLELEEAELKIKDFKERNRGYEDSPELNMIFYQLDREAEAKKSVYLTLQQQLELARIEEVKQSPILHILDHASPPIGKSSPRRILFLVSSIIFGLIFSSIRVVIKY